MPHLDARSWYSFHCGVSSPPELCAQAAELGHPALGLCDVDGTYGLLPFYKAALRHGLRPLLGIALTEGGSGGAALSGGAGGHSGTEAGATRDGPGGRRQQGGINAAPTGLSRPPGSIAAIVIARDRQGYSELCALAAGRRLDPRWDIVRALTTGTERCYVITCREDLLAALAPRLGPGRLFVRTVADYGPPQRAQQERQLRLAQRCKLHPAACTEVCFTRPQDQIIHHLLTAIGQCTSLEQAQGVRPRSHYLAAPTELGGYFYACPEALRNAEAIAESCEVELELGKWVFPSYSLPPGETAAGALRELCQRGLQWRFKGGQEPEHVARLDHELAVIDKLGYSSYFLFVRDIVREASRLRIPCLGRGSAANSLVSYLLGLTPIDPLKYNLYFERFLNPERASPPDIDIDFNWKRRDEILSYVYRRWGEERVALISTHVTYRAKSALRETAKVFGLSDREISQVSRFLPSMNAGKLTGTAQRLPELRGIDFSVEPYKHILPLAARLAGKPRHLGIHCGGIVIAPGRITDFTGLQRAAKGFVVTQYEMFAVEEAGLIKIDLLGNRSLGVLEDSLQALGARGIRTPVHNLAALTTDPATVQMIREGRTMGCFYIESPAMRALLQRLGTQSFEGLTAASSVIRPGVAESGMMQEYIRRVRGLPRVLPSHPLLERILPETHGVMVYQEDVIRVAHAVAGLSPAQADILRRSMSGKLRGPEVMNQLREGFLAGCEKQGVDSASALEIWRQLSSFSGYSFCKAHSASFATLSYQVAWLKAHHPAEFMAAVISNGGGFYGPRAYLSECERLGLRILPPDVNHSNAEYTADGAGIRVGLMVIKGLRSQLVARLVEQRGRGGPYLSVEDLIQRTGPSKPELEALILCGALDSLGRPRPELMWEAKLCRGGPGAASLQTFRPLLSAGQEACSTQTLPRLDDFTLLQLAALEQEHLGMLVSRHPLSLVGEQPGLRGLVQAVELPHCQGRTVRLLGWCIATKRVDMTRREPPKDLLALQAEHADIPEQYGEDEAEDDGEERRNTAEDLGIVRAGGNGRSTPYHYYDTGVRAMKFMSMEDESGTYEVTLFPKAYAQFAPLTRFSGPFIVSGIVEEQFGVVSVNCTHLARLE